MSVEILDKMINEFWICKIPKLQRKNIYDFLSKTLEYK